MADGFAISFEINLAFVGIEVSFGQISDGSLTGTFASVALTGGLSLNPVGATFDSFTFDGSVPDFEGGYLGAEGSLGVGAVGTVNGDGQTTVGPTIGFDAGVQGKAGYTIILDFDMNTNAPSTTGDSPSSSVDDSNNSLDISALSGISFDTADTGTLGDLGIAVTGEPGTPDIGDVDISSLDGSVGSLGLVPIILDLEGDGFNFVEIEESNVFVEISSDGFKSRTSWISSDDAVLAIDVDADGRVSGIEEYLFANSTDANDTDMEAFATLYDSNNDGIFNSDDIAFGSSILWRDLDQDGEFDTGEGQSLAEAQIESIGLVHSGSDASVLNDGTVIHGVTSVVRTDQTTTSAADVAFVAASIAFREELDGGATFRSTSGSLVRTFDTVDDLELTASVEGYLGIVGGEGFDTLVGGENDRVVLNGGGGNDIVIGSIGSDLLSGGGGSDTVFGGNGSDLLLLDPGDFSDGSVQGGEGSDLALIDSNAEQHLNLDLSLHGLEAAFSGGGQDTLVMGSDDDAFIDAGAGDDSLAGAGGDDLLSGNVGDDVIVGGEGANVILGGLGDDTLSAGTGDDAYVFVQGDGSDDVTDAGGADVVFLSGNVGLDQLWLSLDSGDLTIGIAGAGVAVSAISELTDLVVIRDWNDGSGNPGGGRIEKLVLGNGSALDLVALVDTVGLVDGAGEISLEQYIATQFTGGIEGQSFSGTDADEELAGGELADQMAGLAGSDFLFGDAGDDTIDGNDGDDSIAGGAGADTLSGGAGEDVLFGAEGDDLLQGGADDDLYIFGRGNDLDSVLDQNLVVEPVAVEQPGQYENRTVPVYVAAASGESGGYWTSEVQSVWITDVGHDETMTVHHLQQVTDGEGQTSSQWVSSSLTYWVNDMVYENQPVAHEAGINDTLFLSGELGIDDVLLRLENGVLEIALKDPATPTATFDELVDRVAIQNWGDAFSRIERLAFGDGSRLDLVDVVNTFGVTEGAGVVDLIAAMNAAYGDTLEAGGGAYVGDGDDDALTGGDGNDVIEGGAGDDTLAGGAGDDEVYGGDGDDFVSGGSGADTIEGGAGSDTLSYADAEGDGTGVDVTLGDNGAETTLSGGDAEGDVVSDVEHVIGSSGDDSITGNSGINGLAGGSGDDTINGGDGSDLLLGEGGDDVLQGGEGADTIDGGDGQDAVSYEDSDRAVTVDLQNDTASTGTETVTVVDGEETTTVVVAAGDAAGDELIDIEGAIGSQYGDNLIGDEGDNYFDGQGGNDAIAGNGGNDSLIGGEGADLLQGGEGDDVYDFTTGAELTVDSVSETVTHSYEEEYENYYAGTQQVWQSDGEGGGNYVTQHVVLVEDAVRTIVYSEQLAVDGGRDVLRFGAGVTLDDLVFELVDRTVGGETVQDLVVALKDDNQPGAAASSLPDRMVVQEFSVPERRIETFQFEDGTELSAGVVFGLLVTEGADAKIWVGGEAVIDGLGGDDTIQTGDGADILSGGAGDDQIEGWTGRDTLDGGTGDDLLYGGEGNDVYLFDIGGGADTVFDQGIVEQAVTVEEVRTGSRTVTVTLGDGTTQNQTSDYTQTELIDTTELVEIDGGRDVLRLGDGVTKGNAVIDGIGADGTANVVAGDVVLQTVTRTETIGGVQVQIKDLVIGIAEAPGAAPDVSTLQDRITLQDWFNADHRIERIEFADGSSFEADELVLLLATAGADDITWTNTAVNFDAGLGDDTLTGSSAGDTLSGGEGDDLIDGAGSADELIGGAGEDTLIGGTGNDILEGGAGADSLVGGERLDQVSYRNADAAVTVDIAAGTVTGATEATGDTLDGIEGAVGTAYGDTLSGDSLENRFDGLAGDDSINSGDGDDTLDGGDGFDTLYAGAGDDLIIIDYDDFDNGQSATNFILGGDGDDTLVLSEDVGRTVNLGNLQMEHATGSDGTDAFIAAASGSLIKGLGANDTLTGGGGADTLLGGDDNDSITGNAGGDVLAGGAGADMVSGSGGADDLYGGDGDDSLYGGSGDDTVEAGLGDDYIDGGADNDSLRGGAGHDSLYGGSGDDYAFGDTGDDYLGGGNGNDTVAGGAGNDTLYGDLSSDSIGGDDELYGGDGDDILDGGAGADIIRGGDQDLWDALRYTGSDTGVSVDATNGIYLGGDAEGDDVQGIEYFIGSYFNDTLLGSVSDETLNGESGDDDISGAGGIDLLMGNAGNDTIDGGDGDDRIFGGEDDDVLTGGAGADKFYFRSSDGSGSDDQITDFEIGVDDLYLLDDLSLLTLSEVDIDSDTTVDSTRLDLTDGASNTYSVTLLGILNTSAEELGL